MELREAREIAGTLGHPSKMPGLSYGLPAGKHCPVGSKLMKVEGSTCHKCYAMRGHYRYANVAKAQAHRLASITNPQWVEAMVTQINHEIDPAIPYFRWHDSGDVPDMPHLLAVVEVARRCKAVKFWLPTREAKLVGEYFKQYGLLHPRNLCVRVSATMIDGKASSVFQNTSTVVTSGSNCPAPSQGNKCGACRKCWSPKIKNISYHKH